MNKMRRKYRKLFFLRKGIKGRERKGRRDKMKGMGERNEEKQEVRKKGGTGKKIFNVWFTHMGLQTCDPAHYCSSILTKQHICFVSLFLAKRRLNCIVKASFFCPNCDVNQIKTGSAKTSSFDFFSQNYVIAMTL